jgi:hypothetical protein
MAFFYNYALLYFFDNQRITASVDILHQYKMSLMIGLDRDLGQYAPQYEMRSSIIQQLTVKMGGVYLFVNSVLHIFSQIIIHEVQQNKKTFLIQVQGHHNLQKS